MAVDEQTSSAPKPAGGRSQVLSLTIKEKAALYAAYMPWIKHGGIFVPTNRTCNLGDDIYLLLTLMDDTSKLPISGKVVWVTPVNTDSSKVQGVGVAFPANEVGQIARNKIESLLGSSLKSKHKTHTL
jgi:type IV pilus assembly protein PilZ